MEILDLKREDLEALPAKDLESLLKEAEDKAALFDTQQLAEKTIINSFN